MRHPFRLGLINQQQHRTPHPSSPAVRSTSHFNQSRPFGSMKVTIAQKGAVRSQASSRLAPAHSMTLHAARIAARSTGGAFVRPIQRYETSCERTGGTRVSEDEDDSISNLANLIGSVAGDTGNVGRNGPADGRICVLMAFQCRPLGRGRALAGAGLDHQLLFLSPSALTHSPPLPHVQQQERCLYHGSPRGPDSLRRECRWRL